ncbi:MAG: SecD/SecF fusion protein, partial [Urechidicola sp.]
GSKKVDPTISDDFQWSSMKAISIALLFIFLYIFARFRKAQFGIGAIVALIHDVLVVLGIYSIFWGRLPFSMEIDQAFIAAILTVVGYSINDTVVVFDRIREFLRESRKGDVKTIVNRALNSTISRTVNTSLSTFIVLFTIFIFGSESIKGFTFALMVGVIVGTYSSLFIATPLVVDLAGEDLKKDMKAKV